MTRPASLDSHRREIEALDLEILRLVRRRLAAARSIGDLKRSLGIPLRDFEVEAQVRRRFEEGCRIEGDDPALGRDLALFLIGKAVEEQAQILDSDYGGEQLDTVVIGGKGGMGRWMARFLHGQGHRVRILDPSPGPGDFPQVAEEGETQAWDVAAREADLLVLAVPMAACASVLEKLAPLRPRGVVAEMCSFKTHLLPVMEAARASGMRLVSFHPLFGPRVRMLSGRTIVFCKEGRSEDRAVLRALFEKTSARLVELDLQEHDRRMAVVLGLTHLANLVFARAISYSGLDARQMAEVAGVTFQRQLGTTREVCSENPSLYFEIQMLNPRREDCTQWLHSALEELQRATAAADGEDFAQLMTDCDRHLEAAGAAGGEVAP